jgi:TRAP-type uncharacterized transport system substrate-binding protein
VVNEPKSRLVPPLQDSVLSNAGVQIWGVAFLVFSVAVFVAWRYLPPSLPDVVRLGTGPAGGHYARFGDALRAEVAERGINLEPLSTAGSRENIRLLLSGEIDVGLVQSGNLSDAEAARLESIATVFYEPILVAQRADWDSDHVRGGRIAIGAPGSGVRALALELLRHQGVQEDVPPGTRLVEIGRERAVEALRAGEVDTGIFVTSLDVPWVRTLFVDPNLRVTDFALAEAFTRHYHYLRRIVIPAGLIDLRSEIPPHDVELIATTASLVIGPDAHRGVIPLLIESAREQLFQGSLLATPEDFPSGHWVDAPLAEEARQYFERGPSFFFRWLPFHYAFAVSRLAIIILPLLTLLYPLFRSVGPTYRWFVQRRIYRWYRVLKTIEEQMDAHGDAANLRKAHGELERVGDDIRGTHVPSSYGANLFALRVHRRLLVDRLERLEKSERTND